MNSCVRTALEALKLTAKEHLPCAITSLMHVKSRPASVGDKLRMSNFGTGTRGFARAGGSDHGGMRPARH